MYVCLDLSISFQPSKSIKYVSPSICVTPYPQLFVPDKVLIPERYDAEADAEQLTEEESLARKERAERIRKVLTSQR